MSNKDSELLDISEMERRVAQALIDLVDDPDTVHRITPKLLAQRTQLTIRRVREVTDEWNLQTLSGDTYWLSPGALEHARERARVLGSAADD